MKYVLTGGPNSGKTSVINGLREKKFDVIDETAREAIRALPCKPQNEREFIELEKTIFTMQLTEEAKIDSKPGIKFLDRGLPDIIAYCLLNAINVPKDFANRDLFANRYSGIFILERMPFLQDGGRIERDDFEAQRAHERIIEAYTGCGYSLVSVPIFQIGRVGIERRVEFICNYVQNDRKRS
ncbi:MAG TPA: ATP-binding protein [Candidatus Nanoarchaeia archaeon]|nr:ATP-binding protein [Candidatus Nanoarchaeia archaeon]